jgi:hypothetical protein
MSACHPVVMFANPQHDEGLRRLLRETPLRGGITVTLEREPVFFYEKMDTVIAMIDDVVVACGSRVPSQVNWFGKAIEASYLSDLRVHPLYRKYSGRILRDCYQLLLESAKNHPSVVTWTAVFESNLTAMKTLGRQRRAIPEYIDRGGLRSPMLWCSPACKWPAHPGCQRATEADRPELVAFLKKQFSEKALAPVICADDLRMGDFILIREDGALVAAMAVSDFRAIKQIRAIELTRNLRMLRMPMKWLSSVFPLPILPARGGVMPLGYASFMAAENDDVMLIHTMLRAGRVVAAEKGLSFLCACFHEDDPRFRGSKGLPATRADGRLFQVMLSGNTDQWTDQIPHIEAAWL